MAKAKAAKKSPAKSGKKIPQLNPQVLAAANKELARDDISNCEAIRNVAGKFKKTPRKELIAVFVGVKKFNAGTVNRQIQEGRSA